MQSIDIIIPINKRIPFFSGFSGLGIALDPDWYPLFINRHLIQKQGFKLRFFNIKNLPRERLSDIVIFDYRVGKNLIDAEKNIAIARNEKIVQELKRIKLKTKQLVLFDTKDSSNIQCDLLPHVDFYFKKQLLKDSSLYRKGMVGNRLFTDFYHKKYGITEDSYSDFDDSQNIDSDMYNQYKDRIGISWNILLSLNLYSSYLEIAKYLFKQQVKLNYINPNTQRKYFLNGNFRKDYESNLISFQRRKMHEIITAHPAASSFSIGFIPKSEYAVRLTQSQAVLSPYGWGEVCYRDYEAFIAGAALVKPEMGHIATWPDLYIPNRTYLPISWDPEKWKKEIDGILDDQSKCLEVAIKGQQEFQALWNPEGRAIFTNHFVELIEKLQY